MVGNFKRDFTLKLDNRSIKNPPENYGRKELSIIKVIIHTHFGMSMNSGLL